jgi:hypothetical protein
VSGLYVIARARRLATSQASETTLAHFLVDQSDVILMLCGGPVVWYIAQKRRQMRAQQNITGAVVRGSTARAVHQLRQVFTALLLGTELLTRKARAGKTGELGRLALRLNRVVREGLAALADLGEPYPADLLDEHGAPITNQRQVGGADS